MQWLRRRIGLKAGLIMFACGCVAALLAGPAASRQAASPAMLLDFSFNAVGGKRPPNIVQTRIVGKGRLAFLTSPFTQAPTKADAALGTIVVEYDILTPHPRTVRLTLKVTGGRYAGGDVPEAADFARLRVEVVKTDDGDGGEVASCPPGKEGLVELVDGQTVSYFLSLRDCGISHGQKAHREANSRVHVNLRAKCLQRIGASRKPLCGSSTTTGTKPKPKPKPKPAAGTFTLVTSLTEVKNANPKELQIDGAGGTAHLDHCCDGGHFKASYAFKVPRTLVAGHVASVTVGLTVELVEPSQPASFQITVIAPDFRKDLPAHFPDQPSRSATYSIPISANLATSSEVGILISFDNGQVIYHYRK